MDFDKLALAFQADTLSGHDFVSFAFTYAFSFFASPIASLIESTFKNFVFGFIAPTYVFLGP